MGDFGSAVDALERWAESPDGLAALFVGAFPITGASVSTVGNILGSETLSATDQRALRIDELQFDLGEGPCWDALRSARPVLVPDVRRDAPTIWPAFTAAVLREDLSSIFAFPMTVGPLRLGAVDLYSVAPVRLNPTQTSQVGVMADLVGKQVLRRALDAVGQHEEDLGNAYSRRFVHQATGVVLAQLGLSPDEARLVIQGHAFAESRTMIDVAQDIVEGRLKFTNGPTGIEAI
ncbi:ANTAR domain-containing protein [Agromyces fucosus]|uniref:ANTAR domain-containing protein n=1 Tax=Agromyces fucosus TaxID=41985 RepID=A0A4Q2JRX7_9MICO|nr:GAF and ANTAR domain-containing protein [Agromyces fucosus]RXZ48788.1 ANTAR domain-containing protein [Agromyces fucosus]